MRKIILACFFACFILFTSTEAQTVSSARLLKQILDLPAPPPVNANDTQKQAAHPPEFYAAQNIPPDDAPIEDLLDYWERQNTLFNEFRYQQLPTKESLQRILEAIEKDHALLPKYLKLLPAEPEIADVVKRIYETEKQTQKFEPLPNFVRDWLRNNSDMLLGELIESAKNLKAQNGRILNQEDLISLAKVNWEQAKPIVESLENNREQIELYTLAKYVLYHHAIKTGDAGDIEHYREELEKLVENKKGSIKSRDLAMDALVLGGDFAGRDDWYLSLLEDESLLELEENGYTGLTTLIRYLPNEREKWLPAMIKLLDSNNPTLRSAAVRNLDKISGFDNKEVLQKLLPWLTDPGWAKESADRERSRFILALGETDIPESIPGLIALVSNERDENREEAAKVLIKYKSPEAVAVLRRLLISEQNSSIRNSLIVTIVILNGFSDDEMMNALENYAVYSIAKKREIESEDYDDEKLPPVEISIGEFLSEYQTPTDGLVSRMISRIKTLQKTNPEIAVFLLEIMEEWKNPLVDLEMLGWMNSGKAVQETVLKLLAKRAELRERVPNDLSLFREKSAVMRALCTVILNDEADFSNILREAEAETQTAFLAFARLVRIKLPLSEITPLLKNENKLLALAAERYLESEDSREARSTVLLQSKGQARILGARQSFNPDEKANFESLQPLLNGLFQSVSGTDFFLDFQFEALDKTEKELRQEVIDTPGLMAVFGFIKNESAASQILRVYKDKIIFTFNEDGARYWEKTISSKDYEEFTRFLLEKQIDELAPMNEGYGPRTPAGEFVMFGHDGGRRIFYQGYSIPKQLEGLADMLDSFNKGERQLHYRLGDKIKGLEILFADSDFTAKAIWKNKTDFRLLVEDLSARKTILEDLEQQERLETSNGRPDDSLYLVRRERRAAAAYKHFSWRNFLNGKLSPEKIEEPPEIKYIEGNRQGSVSPNGTVLAPEPRSSQRQIGDSEIQSNDDNLVKVGSSGLSTVIKEGNYVSPIVTADNKWIIATRANDKYSEPNNVVRINLQTGKEFRINIPSGIIFYPFAVIPGQNKVLLFRSRIGRYGNPQNNSDPKAPEFYLLDPNTGITQVVKGEFRPLGQQTFRRLQPAAAANEFWAAIYNEKLNVTEVGIYNTLNFSFKPLMKLPEIELTSMNIWIDEPAAKIYFVYQGHLLAAPLQIQPRA